MLSDEVASRNPLAEQINTILDQDCLPGTGSGAYELSDGLESEIAKTKEAGQPIPNPARIEMEAAFGADFSSVRVHMDADAARLSRDVNAHAFTHGNHIYFNQGMFNPSTLAGKHLLAHELTHTLQQGGKQIRRLSITRNLQEKLDCGARRVRWTFTLDNPAPADGYIVQHIRSLETSQNCPSNVSSISLTPTLEYWEAWEVNAGGTRHALHSNIGFTDQSSRRPGTNQSGMQASLGTVKFFLRSTTGDLGSYKAAPATPGSSWGPGRAPSSGALPSTLTQPSWWNNSTEGPVRRWASSWWNCCGDESSHFNQVDSHP
jgi:hypothetical protein